jgi:EAL domain-containing protein (putative c-di-GMP-specific phosphodiesterase class I)
LGSVFSLNPEAMTICCSTVGGDVVRSRTSRTTHYSIAPARLCLEITETAFVGEWGDLQTTLSALARLGVRLALDDFGTGYSSLAHLQRFKVDILKIDRSFVAQLSRSSRDREIVGALTSMSHALGISVVGVEISNQLDTLVGLDCDQGQGFLLASPMLPEPIVALVH